MTISSFTGKHRFLSNFWMHPVHYCSFYFKSNEHAYQFAKDLSYEHLRRVSLCDTAGDAKKAGQKARLRTDWDNIKIGVMYSLVSEKFNDPTLMQQLFNTGSQELIEGNTWDDRFWGVCQGTGENWLGKILMQVRDEKLFEKATKSREDWI